MNRLPRDFLIVGLLVGSFVFVADFIRALYRIGCTPSVEFIRLSSYGHGQESSGNVRLINATRLDYRRDLCETMPRRAPVVINTAAAQ